MMWMPDVNVLVYAHRMDEAVHEAYRDWVEDQLDRGPPVALSVLVAVGFVRIVTNSRIYREPTPLATALAAIEHLGSHPRCRWVAPGVEHFLDVARLSRAANTSGKLVADAQHAALAIAEGCTWVTRDADFARFAPHGLRWQHLVIGRDA
jgi:toxin-antitoxin system PIN domain toxin